MKNEYVIELKPLGNKFMEVTIVGDSDLVLNKMNDVNAKQLIDKRKDKAKDTTKPNTWEEIITSMLVQRKTYRFFRKRSCKSIKGKCALHY